MAADVTGLGKGAVESLIAALLIYIMFFGPALPATEHLEIATLLI
jgi:hypothetical protein